MFPFQASFPHPPNQIQNEGNNGLAPPQQVMLSNPCFTNPSNMGSNPLIQSHINGFNLQHPVPFNGLNTNLNNLNGNFAAMANTHFLNLGNHNPSMQNIQMGRPFMGSIPQGLNQPYGQFCPQNTLQQLNAAVASQQCGQHHNFPQNLNQIAPMQQNGQLLLHNRPQVTNQNGHLQACGNMPGGQFNSHNQPQHMNQVTGFPQNQFSQNPVHSSQVVPYGVHPCSNISLGCSNQGAQTIGSQHSSFPMNQQLGLMNSNAQNNTQGQNLSIPTTMGPVQMQQTQNNLQPANLQWSQGDHGKDGGNNISNMSPGNHHNKNFTRNHHESGKRESANPRFQNCKSQPRVNVKGNFRAFNGKGVKEHLSGGARKTHQANSTMHERVERRSLPLNYTEEILQWREERRKNHPSRSNNEKLAENENPSEAAVNAAKRRRQQLKEILAKQAELGVEVAELPPNYLSETENQACKEDEPKMWGKKGKFHNNYGKKRRGKHGNANRFAKKQKPGENDAFTPPALSKRKNPTLLQKLLSADIKRDKSHLLQAFKFMVMNSFFKDYPAKPLEFPLLTVKNGDGSKSKVMEEKSSCQNGNGISTIVDENGIVEEVEGSKDHDEVDVNDDDENEAGVEDIEKSEGEEGEITD